MRELTPGAIAAARADIQSGALRGARLLERLSSIPVADRDVWLDAVLGYGDLPADDPALPRGAVPYLPCGVEEILTTVREAPMGAEDVLVDLGSGLGRVVILAHLLTGARGLGIEIQDALVERSETCRAALGLPNVSFVRANATEVELDGSVFFLYSPFNGEMLTRVVARIEAVARRRPVVVCAVDLELHGVSWLSRRTTSSPSVTLYDGSPSSVGEAMRR
ncbi:MAG TPA: hypothetical protein VL400_01965 [Polyangiaceae bacterium]|nr:hypothetical protein [Polyangiaceae bacterium]